jgi:biopolymer transport protein ExbD
MEFDEFKNPIREARQGRVKVAKGVLMDMNAMVDMAFLLLTFFMLTTTMVKPKAIELVMPVTDKDKDKTETQAIRESRALTLIPLPDDELAYYFGFTDAMGQLGKYGKEGIRSILSEFKEQQSEPIVIIKPHPDSAFENLIDLLDEVNISGIERYTIDSFNGRDAEILDKAGITW